MAGTLRIVVAGAGWGANLARGVVSSEHGRIVGLWARSPKPHARKLAEELGLPLSHDYAALLREVAPDIVFVAVPEAGHEEMTCTALAHGAHVYCEKVMAPSRDAAERMIAAAAAAGRRLNIGYNYRYSPSCRHVTRTLAAGAIGDPLTLHLRAFSCCLHHMTDYAVSLCGEPTRVVALLDREPLPGKPLPHPASMNFPTFTYTALAKKAYMVEFESGAVLQASGTDYSNVMNPAANLLIEGSSGRLVLDDIGGSVQVWQGWDSPWAGPREASVFTPSQIRDAVGLVDNAACAAADFLRAVAEDGPTPIPGEEGLRMIRLEEAICRSAERGTWETV